MIDGTGSALRVAGEIARRADTLVTVAPKSAPRAPARLSKNCSRRTQWRPRPQGSQLSRWAATRLSDFEAMVLMAIAYFQPIIRSELSKVFGKNVSRDTIASVRNANFLAFCPRSATPGAPYTHVTTKQFLSAFGMQTLRNLPDVEVLDDTGLLSRKGVQEEQLSADVDGDEAL